jgi:hypothetical protein
MRIAWILRRRIERKTGEVLGEDQLGFRRGKGARDAVGAKQIIKKQTLDVDEELCECFIDKQKEFDCKRDQINADPKGN